LVDVPNKEVFEIKPITIAGTGAAAVQLGGYILAFNAVDSTGGWHVGDATSYVYSPAVFTLANPPALIEVFPPVFGIIYYQAQTLKQIVTKKAVQTAVAENAQLEDEVGIASLNATLGAF